MSINAASISNAYIIMYEMEPPSLTSQLPQETTVKPCTPFIVSSNGMLLEYTNYNDDL